MKSPIGGTWKIEIDEIPRDHMHSIGHKLNVLTDQVDQEWSKLE